MNTRECRCLVCCVVSFECCVVLAVYFIGCVCFLLIKDLMLVKDD
jgi:hypothetical protein